MTAIWLSPIYKSPQKDHGYDISDFLDVDPLFGSLSDFKTMLNKAHQEGTCPNALDSSEKEHVSRRVESRFGLRPKPF